MCLLRQSGQKDGVLGQSILSILHEGTDNVEKIFMSV